MKLILIILTFFQLSFYSYFLFFFLKEKSQRLGNNFAKFVMWVQFPPFPFSYSFSDISLKGGKWLSGQKQWTVNPPNLFFIGSNPIFPKKYSAFLFLLFFSYFLFRGNSLIGQALVCQTKSCGFKSRFPRRDGIVQW